MQSPDNPVLKISSGSKRIVELTKVGAVQPNGERIDREIAPTKVVIDAAKFDFGQLTGFVILFASCRDEVNVISKGASCGGGKRRGGWRSRLVQRPLRRAKFGM
jgi:hypothetical protein